MSHYPRKRFGQNFLQDESIIAKILAVLHLHQDDKVIEIGPGLGALTKPLLKQVNCLIAVEIDRDLQAYLSALPVAIGKLQLISADALTIDYSQWGKNLRIVGNLPYNISTPLLLYLLNYKQYINDMHFMLQKEVAARLAASPGSKAYGRLSVMTQYHCEVDYLFDVPPQVFHPQPKVDSAFVCLTPHQVSPYPSTATVKLERLVAQAFSMRRKTLANNLKSVLSTAKLIEIGIDPSLRPEQISVKDYVRIAEIMPN